MRHLRFLVIGLRSFATLLALGLATQSFAQDASFYRWTFKEDLDGSLAHVVATLNQKSGLSLTTQDFRLDEDRDLANNHYQRYLQLVDGKPVRSMSIRLWLQKNAQSAQLVQAEANITAPHSIRSGNDFRLMQRARQFEAQGDFQGAAQFLLTANQSQKIALNALRSTDDSKVSSIKSQRLWVNDKLVDEFVIRARRGVHTVQVGVVSKSLLKQSYKPFETDEQSLDVSLYPIYEEYNGTRLPREPRTLNYISTTMPRSSTDPFASMRTRSYLYSKMDPILAETADGRAQGYWSFPQLFAAAQAAINAIPLVPNTYDAGGMYLRGRYVTINIHPDAFEKFQGITIPKLYSSNFFPRWIERTDGDYEIHPDSGFLGKSILSVADGQARPATRLPDHNPVQYINEGFDELQVYYAVNELFAELKPRGFSDPDLSTRPFHALLFDPDISMRDNAYYTNDTINFTTYSPNQLNMARDNTTIWHELGHGVMDRLMGDYLNLADTGGLSEGMADFVAELVLQGANHGQPFLGDQDQRIINKTGFFLTNEVHDDGEAYGGSMKDMLDASIQAFGHDNGLAAFTDLTLEAMRLSRDHPALTAQDWFNHVLFADEIGSNFRQPNMLHDIVLNALAHRNFIANPTGQAQMQLLYNNGEITSETAGSRNKPIPLQMRADETKAFDLKVKLKSGDGLKFNYPVTVKVFYKSGPLQGAIKWENQDQEPQIVTINNEQELATIPMKVYGTCDYSNRDDGSCVDFAYVQIWNGANADKPVAKKRFYLKIKTQN